MPRHTRWLTGDNFTNKENEKVTTQKATFPINREISCSLLAVCYNGMTTIIISREVQTHLTTKNNYEEVSLLNVANYTLVERHKRCVTVHILTAIVFEKTGVSADWLQLSVQLPHEASILGPS
jgi:hypothetical protein